MRERLFARTLYATAPLWVWAAHFALCYALVAAQCSPALVRPSAPSVWVLALATVLALGVCGTMLWKRRGSLNSLVDWAFAGAAVLALAGIALTAIPLLLLDGCG